jgi:hypothetical protein
LQDNERTPLGNNNVCQGGSAFLGDCSFAVRSRATRTLKAIQKKCRAVAKTGNSEPLLLRVARGEGKNSKGL